MPRPQQRRGARRAQLFYAMLRHVREEMTRDQFIGWYFLNHARTDPYTYGRHASAPTLKPKWDFSTGTSRSAAAARAERKPMSRSCLIPQDQYRDENESVSWPNSLRR